jgi:hypothetical protein
MTRGCTGDDAGIEESRAGQPRRQGAEDSCTRPRKRKEACTPARSPAAGPGRRSGARLAARGGSVVRGAELGWTLAPW